jgi:hypothetical protein
MSTPQNFFVSNNTISLDSARDILSKLLREEIPVLAALYCPTGARSRFTGVVDAFAYEIRVLRIDGTELVAVPFSGRPVTILYGEKRELKPATRDILGDKLDLIGESVLAFLFLDTREFFILNFTL